MISFHAVVGVLLEQVPRTWGEYLDHAGRPALVGGDLDRDGSDGTLSYLFCHRRRGTAAMQAMGVLPGFTGTAVHDAWAPCDIYTSATQSLCGAHLLREPQAVIDHHADTVGPTP